MPEDRITTEEPHENRVEIGQRGKQYRCDNELPAFGEPEEARNPCAYDAMADDCWQ